MNHNDPTMRHANDTKAVTDGDLIMLGGEIRALQRTEKALEALRFQTIEQKLALAETRRLLRRKRAELKALKSQAQGRLL